MGATSERQGDQHKQRHASHAASVGRLHIPVRRSGKGLGSQRGRRCRSDDCRTRRVIAALASSGLVGWGDSNSGPPPEAAPGGGCAGTLTCASFAPVATAGCPLQSSTCRTHVYPPCTEAGPVWWRTPPALRSSATRDRSAGRARQADAGPSGTAATCRSPVVPMWPTPGCSNAVGRPSGQITGTDSGVEFGQISARRASSSPHRLRPP